MVVLTVNIKSLTSFVSVMRKCSDFSNIAPIPEVLWRSDAYEVGYLKKYN